MTDFYVRDQRNGGDYRRATRKTYKRAAKLHDEAGQPLRAETRYVGGVPVKRLTLMKDGGEAWV